MARIFMTGMEDGSLSAFDSVNGASASTSQKRTGAYSLYYGNRDYHARATLPGVYSELYLRFGSYISTRVWNIHPLMRLYDHSFTQHIVIGVDGPTGLIGVWRNETELAKGTTVFTNGVWRCVEAYVKIADVSGETAGAVTIKVDGVTEITFSGDTQNGGTAEVAIIGFGGSAPGSYDSPAQYFDDIAINDVSGAVNNSWVGAGGILAGIPNGAGDHTGLTPSTGANYACVDEVPASDTDYVSSSIVDAYDLYALNTSNKPAVGTIAAIKWIARAGLDVGVGYIAPVIRSGTTTEQQSDIALSSSLNVKSLIMDVDPVDDAAWTLDKLAALEVGLAVG